MKVPARCRTPVIPEHTLGVPGLGRRTAAVRAAAEATSLVVSDEDCAASRRGSIGATGELHISAIPAPTSTSAAARRGHFGWRRTHPEHLVATANANLDCLEKVLQWNANPGIHSSRISSDTVPFASHPVMIVDWQGIFASRFAHLGRFIHDHGAGTTCHPCQDIVLKSPRPDVVERSIAELEYTAAMFDLMGLDQTHAMRIHAGGVYGDKAAAVARFVGQHRSLPPAVVCRLAIENNERQYTLADNLEIHAATGVPVVFDVFHRSILNGGEPLSEALDRFMPTWAGHTAR